jgi:hypothetical protein
VTGPQQYLRLQIGGVNYLLPGTQRYTVEQRDSLLPNPDANSHVSAWRSVKSARWPAYCLDGNLKLRKRDDWQRAVFLEAAPTAVGLIVEEVQLLARGDTAMAMFTPLGPVATSAGHLFTGAWVSGRKVMLLFEPGALIAYLRSLGD